MFDQPNRVDEILEHLSNVFAMASASFESIYENATKKTRKTNATAFAAKDASSAAACAAGSKAIISGINSQAVAVGSGAAAETIGLGSIAVVSGNGSSTATLGDHSIAAASGHAATATATGANALAACVGDVLGGAAAVGNYSRAVVLGELSMSAAVGAASEAASSGRLSKAVSCGNHSRAAAFGTYPIATTTGAYSMAMVSGEGGACAAVGTGAVAKGDLGSLLMVSEYSQTGDVSTPVGGKADIVDGVKLKPSRWYAVLKGKWIEVDLTDGIYAYVLSEKNGVKKVRDLNGRILYVVSDNEGNSAHGKTIAQARADLIYKRSVTFEGEVPKEATGAEWIGLYRAITGACAAGVKDFVECTGKSLSKTYTAEEILELVRGKFGAEAFAKKINPNNKETL